MHKKRPKICTCCRVSEAKFYLYHSTKIATVRPWFDDLPEYPSIQINSSGPWCMSIKMRIHKDFDPNVVHLAFILFCSRCFLRA